MKITMKFDPCRPARALIEMLFENGMSQEALAIAKTVDDAQLRLWNGEELSAANGG
ncbi:MAG: hypothetical protein IJ157_02410 [Clostridia bacterium]|nr:hypothetical protein [Clostridia bacterium]